MNNRYISGIIDRKSNEHFKPKFEDAQEIVNWGLTHPYHGVIPPTSSQVIIPPSSHSISLNPFNYNKYR